MLVRAGCGYTHPGRQQGHSLGLSQLICLGLVPFCVSLSPAVAFHQLAGGLAGKGGERALLDWGPHDYFHLPHSPTSFSLALGVPGCGLVPLGVAVAYLLWLRGEEKGLCTPQFGLSGIRLTTHWPFSFY